ncbi:MAG: TIGR02147 family protein [Halobacteriovoraceae bacterium]|nr:TIGR02147 family protein [Halobacteriovoraceae bacterium]
MLFEVTDYREFIQTMLEQNSQVKGYRASLAEYIQCHRSVLPQVLSYKVNLTLDQAARAARFWGLNSLEQEYFINLVNLERSGCEELKEIIQKRLSEIKTKLNLIESNIPEFRTIPEKFQTLFYSNWIYSAVFVALSIPTYSSIDAVAAKLNLPLDIVNKVISDLSKMKLIKMESNKIKTTEKSIFLKKESPLRLVNHLNWRHKAIEDIARNHSSSVHYTDLFAISTKDIAKIKKMLLNFISESKSIVQKSNEEELVAFSCDFYQPY